MAYDIECAGCNDTFQVEDDAMSSTLICPLCGVSNDVIFEETTPETIKAPAPSRSSHSSKPSGSKRGRPARKSPAKQRGKRRRENRTKNFQKDIRNAKITLIVVAILFGIWGSLVHLGCEQVIKEAKLKKSFIAAQGPDAAVLLQAQNDYIEALEDQKSLSNLDLLLALLCFVFFIMAFSKPAIACQLALWCYMAILVWSFVIAPAGVMGILNWIVRFIIMGCLAAGVIGARSFEKIQQKESRERKLSRRS